MTYQFPPNVDTLLREQMATGNYGSEDELLADALRALAQRDADLDAVFWSLATKYASCAFAAPARTCLRPKSCCECSSWCWTQQRTIDLPGDSLVFDHQYNVPWYVAITIANNATLRAMRSISSGFPNCD